MNNDIAAHMHMLSMGSPSLVPRRPPPRGGRSLGTRPGMSSAVIVCFSGSCDIVNVRVDPHTHVHIATHTLTAHTPLSDCHGVTPIDLSSDSGDPQPT